MKRPLKTCANGCGVPPKPPSLVICGPCMDRISDNLKAMIADLKAREASEKGGKDAK